MYDLNTGETYISYQDMSDLHDRLSNEWKTLVLIQGKSLDMNVGTREYRVRINQTWGQKYNNKGMETVWQGNDFALARLEFNSWQRKIGIFIKEDGTKFDDPSVDPTIMDKPDHNVVDFPVTDDAKVIKFPGKRK